MKHTLRPCSTLALLLFVPVACEFEPEVDDAEALAADDAEDDEDALHANVDGEDEDEDEDAALEDPERVDAVALVAFGGIGQPAQVQRFTEEDLPASFYARGIDELTAAPDPMAVGTYVAVPAGYGHYCSMVWPGGGWAFASYTNGQHPCQYLRDTFGSGTVRKAGLFDASGTNLAVVWCDGVSWGPAIFRGQDSGPLNAAFNAAVGSNEPNCVLTVSPLDLPIFSASPGTFTSTVTGVDFARDAAPMMDTGWFGATGADDSPTATQVSFKGHAKTNFADDHDGWDWGAAEGTNLYAMANGYIIRSRDYQTSAVACGSATAATVAARQTNNCINRDYAPYWPAPCTGWNDASAACLAALATGNYIDYRNAGWDGFLQGEVYVRHIIQTDPIEYRESFVAGYFHVQRTNTPAVWSTVGPGTQIADVGNGGWTSGAHLHMTVIRETNVGTPDIKDRWFTANADNCTMCAGGSHDFHRYAVDPYGWSAPLHIDPRGWMTTDGAMSPDLWQWGGGFSAPSTGTWGN